MIKKIILFFLLVIFFVQPLSAQVIPTPTGLMVNNLFPPFKLMIPPGFIELPREFSYKQGNWFYGFMEEDDSVDRFHENVAIGVSLLGDLMQSNQTVTNESMMERVRLNLPEEVEIETKKIRYKNFAVKAIVAYYRVEQREKVATIIFLPLSQQTLQLTFMAPLVKEETMHKAINYVLISLEGSINKPETFAISNQMINYIIGFALAIVIVFVILSKTTTKGKGIKYGDDPLKIRKMDTPEDDSVTP